MGFLSTRVDNASKYMQYEDTAQKEINWLFLLAPMSKWNADLKTSNSMTNLESFVAQIL